MKRGELTVFFGLIFLLVLSFLFSIIESARLSGVRMKLQTAVSASAESQFAAYDRALLEEFKVFFFDGAGGGGNLDDSYIASNIKSLIEENIGARDLLNMAYTDLYAINIEAVDVRNMVLATDDNGMVFRECAIMSMKGRYGIAFAEELLKKANLIKENHDAGLECEESDKKNKEEISFFDDEKQEADRQKPAESEVASKVENPMLVCNEKKGVGILKMALPKDYSLSEEQLVLENLPSMRALNRGYGLDNYSEDLLSKVLFDEYLIERFTCACEDANKNYLDGCPKYQLEYLLEGKAHDADNLKGVLWKLLLIREGINFGYLMTDQAKLSQAQGVAMALVGYTGIVPLIEATKYGILLSWAYSESISDIRRLLAGKKVAVIKNGANWQSKLTNIADASDTKLVDDADGIEYIYYLRLMLLLEKQEVLAKRCIDLVEVKLNAAGNVQEIDTECTTTEAGSRIRLDNMVFSHMVNVEACSESVFYSFPFVKKIMPAMNSEFIVDRKLSYMLWN